MGKLLGFAIPSIYVIALVAQSLPVPSSKESLKITAVTIKGWLDENGQGVAKRIVSHAFPKYNYPNVSLIGRPMKRSLNLFLSKSVDCYLGIDEVLFKVHTGIEVASSISFAQITVRAHSIKKEKQNIDLKALKLVRLGLPMGLEVDPSFSTNPNYKYQRVHTVQSGIQMLKEGRIDYLLYFHPTYSGYTDNLHINDSIIFSTFDLKLNCWPTEKNKALIKIFNKAHSK